ncbi:MAG: hypothetical protein ACI4KD_01575, partial [Oscillospiraceae bacterium]
MNDNELNNINSHEENDFSNEKLIADIKKAKSKADDKKSLQNNKDNQQKHSSKKKRRKRKKNTGKIAFRLIIFCIIVIVACFCAFVLINLGMEVTGLGRHDETELIIEIPQGATTSDIADILVENEIINNPLAFRVLSNKKNANSYKAGKHKI